MTSGEAILLYLMADCNGLIHLLLRYCLLKICLDCQVSEESKRWGAKSVSMHGVENHPK